MKNQAVYVYAFSVPTITDADGKVTRVLDKNGNEYVTIYAHGPNEDEDGLFMEPVSAISTMNSAVATIQMYKHLMAKATGNTVPANTTERKAAGIEDGQELLMLKKPVAFAGVVEKCVSDSPYLSEDGDKVNRHCSFIGWGAIEVAKASVKAQFDQRMDYLADEKRFITEAEATSIKAGGVRTAPTAQLTSVIGG